MSQFSRVFYMLNVFKKSRSFLGRNLIYRLNAHWDFTLAAVSPSTCDRPDRYYVIIAKHRAVWWKSAVTRHTIR